MTDMRGRRPVAGTERTPSGAISRSKSNIAKRAEKIRQSAGESAKREARVGLALKERTQLARGRAYGLTPQQAASHHASTIEGRLHLKGVITATELLALEHYQSALARYGRAIGVPVMSGNPLARYLPAEPRAITAAPSGASVELARLRYEEAENAVQSAGPKASWAIACVCRQRAELPEAYRPFFLRGVQALVRHFRLAPDPDRAKAA